MLEADEQKKRYDSRTKLTSYISLTSHPERRLEAFLSKHTTGISGPSTERSYRQDLITQCINSVHESGEGGLWHSRIRERWEEKSFFPYQIIE
jgi:hypothetical protein